MQKLGSSMDFGQEAILGLAGDGLPDLSSALPEAAASLPQVPASTKPAKAAGVKSAGSNDLMPPPALKAIYDRVAAEEGVPVNVLVAMGHTESRHRADIDGPQTKYGAAGGIMQYLPSMAAAHKINRYNPEESIRQAAKDLRKRLANNKGDMANAVARHHAGDNPQQLGPKSRQYAETILAKARRLAPIYEAEQAAMVKDASKSREAAREQAAEAKRSEYYPAGGTKPASVGRTWLQAGGDTLAQLAEGVNTIAGAPAELIAPDSGFAQFFRDGADYWRNAQSEDMQRRIAQADKRIAHAGEDGLLAQMAAAASAYTDDPALAARLVASNAASLVPGVAAAKLSQAAAIARGATAAKAAAAATTAAGGMNAVLNAGGARGEAYQDLRQTLIAKGMAPEAATEIALRESLPSAAAGGLAGFLSGKIGLEKALVGQGGAGVRGAVGAAAAELAGEQVEEVAPQIATNLMASRHDGRSLLKDVGRTIVETGVASGPGAAMSAVASHGPIGRAVSKAQAAPITPTSAADDDLDRPPVDEPMFASQEQEPGPAEPGQVPATPAWGHQPAAELAGQPVEVGRKENFAADYPVPQAPDAAAIADVDARVASAREQESAAQRRQILDGVLSDSAVRNPVAKFAAELARAGYAQAVPSADELATIERFSSAKDAFASADLDAPLREPAAPNEMGGGDAVDWRTQRDAEIMPGADALSTPLPKAGMQKNAREAQLSTTLPADLEGLADATGKPGPFIKKLRKAGYAIRDADHERQLINQFKEYKANGTAATDTNTGNALAQAQPAGDTGRAERLAADAQPGRDADGGMDAGRRQRNDQAVAADGGAGKQPASVKQGKSWHAKAKEVDLSRDTVRDAVARLGGIRKDEAMREWGATLVEGAKSRIFGKPVFRAKGGTGMSLDKMREALAELGYLQADSDINDLYQAFEQDSLHHVGQERRAATMAQQAATESQAAPVGEAAAAMPERTLDNHPVYDPWYDFDPDAILPDDLNEAAASAGEVVADEDAEMFEAITTKLHQVLGSDEAEAIAERAAIMADSGKNFFEAVLELINERQEAESSTGAAKPAAAGGKVAEAPAGQAGARTDADIQQGQPDAGRAAADAGQSGSDAAGILQSYDQAELDAREQAQRAADSRRQEEERAADRKRQADAAVGDFVLTGSDSIADQLAARGQGGLFDESGLAPDAARQSRLSNEPTASAASRIPAANGQSNDSTAESGGEALEFPTQQIADSYRHISHHGSDRAKAEENAFRQSIEQIRSDVGPMVETEAQQAAFDSAMAEYQRGYIDASLKLARAREGTVSPLVAGRNNFNGKQAARTGGAYEKAQDEFAHKVGRLKAAVEEAVRDARTPDQIQAEQDKAAEKARKKLILDFAKAAGAIADDLRNDRKAMAGDTRKWANKDMMALLDGMDEATQRQAIEGTNKALKELGGLAVVVGPRSALGKRVTATLAHAPEVGDQSKSDSILPDGARLSVAEADALNIGGEKASTDLAFHFRTETGKPFTGGLKVNAVQAIVSDVTSGWKNLPAIEAVQGFDELPAEIQQECRHQGGNEYSVQGILSRKSNKVYVIAGNHEWAREVEATLFHEIIGHYGLGILTSDDAGEVQAEHLRLFKMVGGRGKLMEMAARFGVAKDIESYRKNLEKSNWSQATQAAILFDELIAHIAQKQPSGWKHALRLAHGYLRSFLRQAGFKRLATLNDADVSVLVNEAARAVRSSAKNASKRASKMSIANAQAGLPLSIDDLHDVFRQSPLGSWVNRLIASGRLTIKPSLVLPEGYKHLEATQAFTVGGKITMFAGNIGGRQRVMPVLLHEVFHSSGEALLGSKEWGKLMVELDQLRQHAEANPAGKAGKLWGDAKRRVQEAIENGDNMTREDMAEELGAYAIELADQAPLTWQRWVDRLLGHIKDWARRTFGVQLGRLTPAQLRAMAIAALKDGRTMAGSEGVAQSMGSLPDQIEVDGVMRPTLNENGKRISATMDGIKNFWRWVDGINEQRLERASGQGPDSGGIHQPSERSIASERYFFDEQGRPRVFYHGTADSVESFDLNHPNRKDHGWLGRGVYLTNDTAIAETYATQKKGLDVPKVMSLYAAIHNPLIATSKVKRDFSKASKAAINLWTDKAIAAGYDGVILDFGNGAVEVVAFNPNAVKSSTENNGDFDPANPDIRYSTAPEPEQEAVSIKKGNLPGADARDSNIALGRDAQRRLVSEHPTWAQRLRDIGLKGLRPTLSMLPGNAVVDLYRDKLPALELAQKHGERLDGMRQTLQKEADETFRAWGKLPAHAADKMADLMHEATIWQLHPDQPAPDKLSKKWAAKHARLADDWAALPAEAQAVYREVRDLYAKRTEQMFDALADRIGRMSGLGTGARSKMLADLRERFDKTLGEGPYFPLSRFGDFLVVAKRLDSDGKTLEKIVLAAETEHEQRILQQDLLGRGFDVVELDTAVKNFRASSLGADLSGFAAGLIDKLDGIEMSDDQRADILDDINQMLIDALPPASARKHFKHRKGVPGFSNDAVRAFVRSQASMASHIANITYQDRIDKALQDARKQAKQDQINVNELGAVVKEMEERAELARRFVAHPIANALTQLGFANFLGFSLSQGLLNLTQVPLLTYPALAAKFGEAKTHAAMRGAYAKVGRALTKKGGETWGDVRTLDDLDDDSRLILKAMEERGKLDLTMALDLVQGGAGPQAPGRSRVTRAAQWVGRYSGWFNHISEAANRQVTAIAGYKLALGQGMSRDQAVDYVAKLLDDSQFNYAFSNRPRRLMSNTGRVIGLMHTFAINAMYRIGRNLYHAMGDWKTEDGREARSIMLRILTVQAAMAGLSSLPLLPLAGAAVGTAAHKATGSRVIGAVGVMAGVGLAQALMAGMGADDDEPWDFDAERRRILNDIAGSRTIAELLDKGLLRALGMDVANRISMNDLLMRDVDTGFTSKPVQDWLDNAFLQSIVGAAYGALKQYARATDLAMDGQYHRAVEAALPKSPADVLKASRYAREGVRVPVGPASAHKADATALDVAWQALGFTPSTVAEVNSSERAQRKAVAQMQERRSELLKAWLAARLEKNADAEKSAVERIAKFNRTQRDNGSADLVITGADRMSKLRSQKRGVERREHGELFGKKYRGLAEDAGGMYGDQ